MEQYRSLLEEFKAPQRYKARFSQEDVFIALKETYKHLLNARSYENMDEHIQKVAKWLSGDFKAGLLLYGTIGSGKTTLMNSVIRYLTITEPRLRLSKYSAIDIAKKYQKGEGDIVQNAKLLFIDDLGEEPLFVKDYGNEISPLVQVLYNRYDRRQFTVITTNKTEQEIKEIYGERIADRFKEMFDRIFFNNQSFRK